MIFDKTSLLQKIFIKNSQQVLKQGTKILQIHEEKK